MIALCVYCWINSMILRMLLELSSKLKGKLTYCKYYYDFHQYFSMLFGFFV